MNAAPRTPATLVNPYAPPPPPDGPLLTPEWWFAIGVVALLAFGALLIALLRRLRPARDDRDLAFQALARRLGLRRRDRVAIRSMASEGAHPVALLLSPTALAAAEAGARLDPSVANRLRQRLGVVDTPS